MMMFLIVEVANNIAFAHIRNFLTEDVGGVAITYRVVGYKIHGAQLG